MQGLDSINYESGLVALIESCEQGELVSRALVRPEILCRAIGVLRYDRVCCGKDVLGGAIVLLQKHCRSPWKVTLKLGDVSNVRSAEGIDRLIGVTNNC